MLSVKDINLLTLNKVGKIVQGTYVTTHLHNVTFKGYLAKPLVTDPTKLQPGVLIAHTWRGLDEFIIKKADALAKLGIVAYAADLFGEGKVATTDEEAFSLIAPLFVDRLALQERMNAAFSVLKEQPQVAKDRIGAIGFCFGGLSAIELLRSGADVKAIVSFHGVLGNELGGHKAKLAPSKQMLGSALILHGNDDPSVTDKDIAAIRAEFTKAKIDWQFHVYGNAMHAFTNPLANSPENGLLYNRSADHRSWIAMQNFFKEKLQ